ncbi:MAG: large-conductance mechanosensitive channel protein MscL [Bacteroidales bacterium]|nr:large-conductance mechanosensitive channel protein MscL [Bacteroidales bacterium]
MGKLIKEFKEFAVKGNAIDMAVAVVIGGAFGAIVTSLVNDIIMPCVGYLLGGKDFSQLAIVLKEAVLAADGTVLTEAVAIKYGVFINAIISFLIISFSIFLVIKGLNKLKKKKAEEPAPPAEPSAEEKLLTEIRDLLKNRQ